MGSGQASWLFVFLPALSEIRGIRGFNSVFIFGLEFLGYGLRWE
jgi:hypothetical protein